MAVSLLKVGRTFERCLRQVRSLNTSFPGKQSLNLIAKSSENNEQTSQPPKVEIDPLKHPDYFGVRKLFTIKDLFDAKVHLGHKIGSMNEQMTPFIFGKRFDSLIIDLDQTASLLRDALNFTAHIAFCGGIILFASRHSQMTVRVEETAKECGEYSHARYWRAGIFTDSLRLYKAEVRLPELVIFLSTLGSTYEQHPGVVDAAKLLVPTVGIVDTNCDPRLITYPVPGNDDTPEAVELYLKVFKEAILLGKAKKEELASREDVSIEN